jgi:hypothetical protein
MENGKWKMKNYRTSQYKNKKKKAKYNDDDEKLNFTRFIST